MRGGRLAALASPASGSSRVPAVRSRTRTEAACLAAAVAEIRLRHSAAYEARRHLRKLPVERREQLEQEWAA